MYRKSLLQCVVTYFKSMIKETTFDFFKVIHDKDDFARQA